MSISKRKLKANRANAQKSTGPKSAAAKEKVSQNSVNHGLCGRFDVLPCEHQDDYDLLLQRLHEEEKPVGTAEIELVVKMAQHTWLCRRALRLQEACFSMEPPTPGQTRGTADYRRPHHHQQLRPLPRGPGSRLSPRLAGASTEKKRKASTRNWLCFAETPGSRRRTAECAGAAPRKTAGTAG